MPMAVKRQAHPEADWYAAMVLLNLKGKKFPLSQPLAGWTWMVEGAAIPTFVIGEPQPG